MPIGSTNVYNPGDLILSTVSGSGTSFIETKIIAATSSFILFNSSGTLTSASLNSIVSTTSSYVSGSTSIITNLTASNISASGTSSFGYVGIGTSSPSTKLQVNFGDVAGNLVNLVGDGATNGSSIATNWITGVSYFDIRLGGTTSTYTKLRIKNDGNVGIGTTSPSSAVSFNKVVEAYDATSLSYQVNSGGTYKAEFGISSNGGWLGTSTTHDMRFASNGTERMRIDSSGNILIGGTSTTNSPIEFQQDGDALIKRLFVTTTTGSAYAYINSQDGYESWIQFGGQTYYNNGIIKYSDASNFMSFWTNTTEKMRILSGGNVGIGTSSPGALLEISSSTAASLLNVKGAGGNGILFVSGSGNVGIGTSSPVGKLHVVGGGGSGALVIQGNGITSHFHYGTNEDTYIRPGKTVGAVFIADVGGNVGIGTTTTTAKLHVSGSTGGVFEVDTAGGVTSFYVSASGNIGIGTSTSILGKLQLDSGVAPYYGPVTSSATPNGMFTLGSVLGDVVNTFGVDASATAYAWIQPRKITVASYSNLVLNPNGGNVGIGTTLPASKFHISGSGQTIMRLDSDTTSSVSQFQIKAASDAVLIMGMLGGSAASTNFGVTAAGQAYFGTSTLGSPHPTSLVIGNVSNIPIAFSTNNVERMRIDGVGNVGIGTTSATNKLEVIGGTNTRINLGNIDDVNRGGKLEIISGSATARQFYVGTNSAIYNLVFGIDSIEKMRIDTAGNVGIGTTSPAYLLDVSGSSRHGYRAADTHQFTGSVSVSGSLNATASWANNVVSASYALTSSFATRAQTANALNALNTYSIAGLTSAYVDVDGAGTIPTTGIYRPSTKTLGLSADGTLIFKISNVSSPATSSIETGNFVIQSGNVGIGTTSPTAQLHICLDTSTYPTKNVARIVNLGYSGITGAQNWTLRGAYQYGGGIALNADGGDLDLIKSLDRNTILATKTDGTQLGNVGIGTTNPTARLHVSGSTIITGSLNVSANITCLSLTETSTEAVKYNILPLPSQLDNVIKLKPVSFNYKANDKHSIGLIAEEVAKIYPEFTSDNNDSISYGKITSVLIQSIKELKTIIDNQQKQIENLIDKLK